eukprot:ctg_347.g172
MPLRLHTSHDDAPTGAAANIWPRESPRLAGRGARFGRVPVVRRADRACARFRAGDGHPTARSFLRQTRLASRYRDRLRRAGSDSARITKLHDGLAADARGTAVARATQRGHAAQRDMVGSVLCGAASGAAGDRCGQSVLVHGMSGEGEGVRR